MNMRKLFVTGAIVFFGVVAPVGALATGASAGASVTRNANLAATTHSLSSALAGSVSTTIQHLVGPLSGERVLGVHKAGLTYTATAQSTNWSGYVDTSDTFQTISSSWTQPTVTCKAGSGGGGGLLGGLLGGASGSSAYSSFWVGLDGYTSKSVEQTGTDSDCTSSGTPSYYAWYEMYPAGSIQLSTATYPVKPGDVMTGSVTSSPSASTFTMTLTDNTAHWVFTFTASSSGLARSSAEWVAEAPSECNFLFCSQLPLADFGTVAFSNAVVTNTAGASGPISKFNNVAVQMASGGTVEATPSFLNAAGNGFSVAWNS
jgi:hypothetical protein